MKRYLIAGLLVWVPLGITIWVLNALVTTLDQTLLLLPESARPDKLLGFHIPGFGVLLFGRIPFVKSIYSSVKQVSDTVLSDQGTAFRKALLIEFPRPGCWTIAFMTGTPAGEIADHLPGEHISVYVPTTPNPTGGYFVMLPRASARELDITVDEALKYIISMGVVAPRVPIAPPARALPVTDAAFAAPPPRN
jgi:uncharacterized membrane protein